MLEPGGHAVQFRLSCSRKNPAGHPTHVKGSKFGGGGVVNGAEVLEVVIGGVVVIGSGVQPCLKIIAKFLPNQLLASVIISTLPGVMFQLYVTYSGSVNTCITSCES